MFAHNLFILLMPLFILRCLFRLDPCDFDFNNALVVLHVEESKCSYCGDADVNADVNAAQ